MITLLDHFAADEIDAFRFTELFIERIIQVIPKDKYLNWICHSLIDYTLLNYK